uniref:Uncharacterized protein n=1 Tax=Amphimedon queenslandica TaxID=400682 RepID=A0A1X7U470_AMPQE
MLMWTCSTLYQETVLFCTTLRMSPRVKLGHSLSGILLPTLLVLSKKVIDLSKLSRNSSITALKRGTFQHRKPVTLYYNFPCTKHQGVLSTSVLIALEKLKQYTIKREGDSSFCVGSLYIMSSYSTV